MLQKQEKESISEVLEILNYMGEEYTKKISPKFLRLLEENKDINYKEHIDRNIDINSQISKSKTKELLGIIYYNYWCDADEKKEFVEILKENEEKKQRSIQEEYQYKGIMRKNVEKKENNNNLTVTKNKWYEKLIKKLSKYITKFRGQKKNE